MTARKPTAKQVARGIVVSLIRWELVAADSDQLFRASQVYDIDVLTEALVDIADQLTRAGALDLDGTDITT